VTRPTRATRELACLALGHEDGDASACPATDEELLAALVQEVQRLRVAAGEVEEAPADEAERIAAVVDALADTDAQWLDERARASAVVDWLAEDGWQLTRRRT
jgi:hypothetical protein